MGEIYEWLYDEYAEAALYQEPLFQDHVLEEVLAAAPEDIRLGLFDRGRRRTTAPDRSSAPSRRQG